MPKCANHIDFLGYCFQPRYTKLRKRIKQSFARKHKSAKTEKRKKEVNDSYYGWCKWANCATLFTTITDMSFSTYGIKKRTTTKDGKKIFDFPVKRLFEIVNLTIFVVDFETNIKTAHGDGRYVVHFRLNDNSYKFVTNSYSLKNQLDDARKLSKTQPGIFPIETIIRQQDIGNGKHDFYFE
jgi:hypothetical protein